MSLNGVYVIFMVILFYFIIPPKIVITPLWAAVAFGEMATAQVLGVEDEEEKRTSNIRSITLACALLDRYMENNLLNESTK